MKTIPYHLTSDLRGERGLLAAVIAVATRDALGRNPEHRASAWRYFASAVYDHHVTALGLPPETLPAPIRERAARA